MRGSRRHLYTGNGRGPGLSRNGNHADLERVGGIVPHHRRVSRIPLSGECVFGADKRQLSCKAVAALAVAFYVFPGDADTKTRGQQMLPPVLGLGDHSKV